MDPTPEWSFLGEAKRWRLRREKVLGRGSFGVATLVRDLDVEPQMGSRALFVAKEISLGGLRKASEFEALEREIRILKKVSHPNVVTYVDSSSDDDERLRSPLAPTLTILMEYCDGGDLHDLIQRQGTKGLPEPEVASLLIQVLVGLRHLHLEHRILHRDLKPQNIFLTSSGIAKIGDFGVSTTLAHSADFAKTFCGSPYYLAPELCEEKPYNGKADLWSLGVIFYECMAKGQKPFPAKNLVALVFQITKSQFDRAPLAAYSSELADIVGSLLQRQPGNRPTFARLLRNAYLLKHLPLLPIALMSSDAYTATFGCDKMELALSQAQAAAGGGPKSAGGRAPPLSRELMEWAEHDRRALCSVEASRGLPVNAGDEMSEREKRQMVRSSVGGRGGPLPTLVPPARRSHEGPRNPTSDSSPSLGTSTANATTLLSSDDETWNSRYEDDGFEESDSGAGEGGAGVALPNTKKVEPRQSHSSPARETIGKSDQDADLEAEERLEAAAYASWQRQDSVPLCETSFQFS